MNMPAELLPCPFCESPACSRFVHGEYWISCTATGVCYGRQDGYRRDKEGHYVNGYSFLADAIAAWNRRANLSARPGVGVDAEDAEDGRLLRFAMENPGSHEMSVKKGIQHFYYSGYAIRAELKAGLTKELK